MNTERTDIHLYTDFIIFFLITLPCPSKIPDFKSSSKPDGLQMGSDNFSILSAQNVDAVDIVRIIEAINNHKYSFCTFCPAWIPSS